MASPKKSAPNPPAGERPLFLTGEEMAKIHLERQQEHQRELAKMTELIDYPDEQNIDYDDVTALNNLLAELGASSEDSKGFITVFKETITNGAKSEKYMGRFDVVDYDSGNLLDHLKNNFGGGRYHIRVYTARKKIGGVGMAANKWIDIDGGAAQPSATLQTIHAAPQLDLSPLMQTMQQGFAGLLAAMQANQPKQTSRMEMLEEMKAIRDITAPAVQPASAANYDPVSLLKLGVEMANNNNGGSDNSWVNKMIETFAPAMMTAFKNQQEKTIQPQQPVQSLPAQTAQPQQAQPQQVEDEPMTMMMKGYLKMLSTAASQNQDVEEYADQIINLVPSTQLPEFETMLRSADWQTQLAKHADVVNLYPVWFTNLRNVTLEFIDADRADEQERALTAKKGGASVTAHETSDTPIATNTDNSRRPT